MATVHQTTIQASKQNKRAFVDLTRVELGQARSN